MKFKKSLLQKNSLGAINHIPTLSEFLRQIDLNKIKLKKIEALLHGSFQSTINGPGFDFNEIREYRIGDDLRHISWNATAKTGNLQTKEYFSEKEIRSYFLIDISNSMFCGNKIDPFIQLVAYLLNLACGFSEKIGGVFFSENIQCQFPLGMPNTQANVIFQTFINYYNNLNQKITVEPSTTNLSKALEFTKKYFSKKGIVFIISDFLNFSTITNWEKIIYDAAQKQNIYSFQIYDPLDFELPRSGYISFVDPETKEYFLVNTDSKIIHEKYYKLMKEKQENLKKFLKTSSINHITIEKSDFM